MNLCTDQLAMLIAETGQLYSVSHLAIDEKSSSMTKEAAQYQINHGLAEEVFMMKPDLILAGAYTTPATVNMLQRLGFRVEIFPLDNSFEDMRGNIRKMGDLLGQRAKAETLIAQFDKDLADITRNLPKPDPLAVLYYPNSYTSGGGSLAHDILKAAGVQNLAERLGFQGLTQLSLEHLVMNRPDLIITGGGSGQKPSLADLTLHHPALIYLQKKSSSDALLDKRWICGTPHIIGAVKKLIEVRKGLPSAGKIKQ